MNSLKNRVFTFNKGRDEQMLSIKYKRMQESASRFFRGSCHLFYEDLQANELLLQSPKGWICGDLHLENFGSYTAADGNNYFEINDFDESELAPILFDVCRVLVSIVVFSNDSEIKIKQINKLMNLFWNSYSKTIINGKPYNLSKETAKNAVLDLLKKTSNVDKNFLWKPIINKNEKIIIEKEKTYNLAKDLKNELEDHLKIIVENYPALKGNKIKDIVGRIAGTGSIGLARYLVLLYQKSTKDYQIIDIKKARKSSLHVYNKTLQPAWKNEAERICFAQNILQYQAPAVLQSWQLPKDNFVARTYNPSEAKIEIADLAANKVSFQSFISDCAKIMAYSHLRATSRNGADSYDQILAWINTDKLQNSLIKLAIDYGQKVEKDYKEFSKK